MQTSIDIEGMVRVLNGDQKVNVLDVSKINL